MHQADTVWDERGNDYPQDLPGPLEAGVPSLSRIWKRRIQLLLIALMGWIAQNLGWGVSLAIHAAVAFILGFFIVPTTLGSSSISLETRIGNEEEVRVELTDTIDSDQTSIGGAPLDLTPVIQEVGSTEPHDSKLLEFNPDMQSTSMVNAIDRAAGGSGKGTGMGVGDGIGMGKVEFFGTKGSGNSVVYVVDISGSMASNGRFHTAIDEILRSLDKLTKLQRFYIIFYNHGEIPLFEGYGKTKLLVANPATKTRTRRWIKDSLGPGGGTNPIPALEHALRMRPDLIYLMTDGEIPPETRDFIVERNKKKIVVHTIAFQSADGRLILKNIAEDNGGTFRFVP